MKNGWMIRAGRGSRFFSEFEQGYIAIGWNEVGDLNQLKSDDALRDAYITHWGDAKPGATGNAIAMIRKFHREIQSGDMVITYSSELREYMVGEDLGEYRYAPEGQRIGDYAHTRKVKWLGKVPRDQLSTSVRNSLGSTLTLFSLSDDVIRELQAALTGAAPAKREPTEDVEESLDVLKDQVIEQSHELIKDKIQALLPEEMEELVAAVLRAMGYKTKVSPRGPDRGVDVMASPDGLSLTQPRIKAEVKHRSGSMGSQAIRSFLGALREGDSGLYISTGGFSKEARYEAERATMPVTLIDIDDLADLIVIHYDNFDSEGRTLIPLIRVYWPAE